MTRLADLILSHKRLVVAFWAVVTVAAFAAVGPAGKLALAAVQHPRPRGLRDQQGHRADLRQRRRRRPARPGRHASEGHDRRLAGRHRRARLGACAGEAGDAGRTDRLLRLHPRPRLRLRGRPHHVRARLPPRRRRRRPRTGRGSEGAGRARRRHRRRLARPGHRAERASCGAGRQRVGRHRRCSSRHCSAALGALLVLVFVFRSFMAIVPLLMAAVAIPTTFLLIWPIASVTDVSVIVQFLVALIGLGIAIDYALLVVVRWREERRGGEVANETAVRNAMQHAGSAVVFSGTTVAISLLALLALPMPALRSIGIAGLLIALVSVAVANTLLPVVLATVGPRLDRPRSNRDQSASRAWSAWARIVVRHRWLAAIASTAVLAALVARGLADPARRPAGRLARPEGPRPRRSRAAEGLRHRHRAALTVRSARPLRQPGDRRRRDRQGRRRPDAPSPRPTGAATAPRSSRSSRPQDANSAAGRATLDRIRAADDRRRDRRRRSGSERRLPRRRLRQLPADDPR